jgi:hypothetical protein
MRIGSGFETFVYADVLLKKTTEFCTHTHIHTHTHTHTLAEPHHLPPRHSPLLPQLPCRVAALVDRERALAGLDKVLYSSHQMTQVLFLLKPAYTSMGPLVAAGHVFILSCP